MRKKGILICISGALASAPFLLAAVSAPDASFMKMAAKANMTEAHVGQMAEAQASQQAVKDFGDRLSKDHTMAYETLTALANKTGETIPTAIDAKRDATIQRLAHLKGGAFDRAFLMDEVQSHKKTVAEFQHEADHGQNPDVKAWAKDMLPTLEGHLQAAENLSKQAKTAK